MRKATESIHFAEDLVVTLGCSEFDLLHSIDLAIHQVPGFHYLPEPSFPLKHIYGSTHIPKRVKRGERTYKDV